MSLLKDLIGNMAAAAPADMDQTQYLRYVPAGTENGEQDDQPAAEEEELLHNGLVVFFADHDNPSEEDVQAFADEQGIDFEDVIERAFTLLHNLLNGVGKHNDVPDDEFDPDQLEKGINVEREHTNDLLVAKMIAKDHLSELPDYYDRLENMEDGAKEDGDVPEEDEYVTDDEDEDSTPEVQFKMSM